MHLSLLRFTLLLISSFLFIMACSKDDDLLPGTDDEETELADDETGGDGKGHEDGDIIIADSLVLDLDGGPGYSTLSFNNGKDASLVIVRSEQEWEAETDAEWLKLTAWSGDRGYTGFIVGAAENKKVPRSGLIIITSGKNVHEITADQSGAPYIDFEVNGADFRMILVEGGTFMMGDAQRSEASPVREVSVSWFYIGETQVTNRLWSSVMGELPYDQWEEFEGHDEYNKHYHPVSTATWYQVHDEFMPALNDLTGTGFRLPTEAEWEYAATGGRKSEGFIFAGGDTIDHVAWYFINTWDRETSRRFRQGVGQRLPNELGLYDMTGNVYEWCSDWYEEGYDPGDTDNPEGPSSGTEKVIRGGSYFTQLPAFGGGPGPLSVRARSSQDPDCMRICSVNPFDPDDSLCFDSFCEQVGFRLVIGPF